MSQYLYCCTPRGEYEHIRDGEACHACRDWVKAGRPQTTGNTPATAGSTKKRRHECGTVSGARSHQVKGETVCEPCQEAWDKQKAENGHGCGTPGGASRHQRKGEPVCAPCKAAKSAAAKERRDRLKKEREGKPKAPPVARDICGTYRGYKRHQYYYEEPCDACKAAISEYQRNYSK